MRDRTLRAAAVAIAVGIWLQLLAGLGLPVASSVEAQFRPPFQASDVQAIRRAVEAIANGGCRNRKVC